MVHYFTKYGSGECYFSADFMSESESDEEDAKPLGPRRRTLIPEVIPLELGTLPLGPLHGLQAAPAWSSWSCFRCVDSRCGDSAPPSAATSSVASVASSPALHVRSSVRVQPAAGPHRLSLQGEYTPRA